MGFKCPHCGKEIITCIKCGKIGDEHCVICFPRKQTAYHLQGKPPRAMY